MSNKIKRFWEMPSDSNIRFLPNDDLSFKYKFAIWTKKIETEKEKSKRIRLERKRKLERLVKTNEN